MTPQPLPKAIHTALTELGVETLELRFQGGSDQGFLDISANVDLGDLESKIEDWAWEVYYYNGAGDGNDYGDNITYDLKNNTVTTQEWFMERHDKDPETLSIEISEE